MFPYRVKYTESESDIQNINLLYKIDPKYQNTFDFLENVRKFQKYILIPLEWLVLLTYRRPQHCLKAS